MACKHALFAAIAGASLVGCGAADKKVTCSPVPSFASPAVSCVAAAEPKPEPPPPVAKPEPKPDPEPTPEPPKPVVVKKESIELDRTVQFEPDSAKLIPDSRDLLDEVAKALEEHTEIKLVSIEGHTDSRMSSRHNQKLSVARANSVRTYLISKGVAKDRLVAKGFGETQPVGDNATWKGRFQNRRVHLKILKRDDDGGDDARPEKTVTGDDSGSKPGKAAGKVAGKVAQKHDPKGKGADDE